MHIAIETPDQPEVARLIDELDAYQRPLYPPESHHGIDIAALLRPEVVFAVVRDAAGAAVGCGAIVVGPELGEIKRMFVRPSHRGQGAAARLLSFLENEAERKGCRLFALETGVLQHAAIALYERAGYVRCVPFGDYGPDPHSVFMRKSVAGAGPS